MTVPGNIGVSSAKDAELDIIGGSPNVGGNVTVSAGAAAFVRVQPSGAGGRVRGSVLVTGGTGADTVRLTSRLQVDRNLTLNLKGGDNQVDLGTAGLSLPLNVGGALSISGGAGADTHTLIGVKVATTTAIRLGAGGTP